VPCLDRPVRCVAGPLGVIGKTRRAAVPGVGTTERRVVVIDTTMRSRGRGIPFRIGRPGAKCRWRGELPAE